MTGFVAQMDINQMFHCFNLHPELWPYFCITHLNVGFDLAFPRLPMGWISSPGLAREMITRIMYDHLDYCSIYMDDFVIVANSAEELLDRVEKVFKTLKYRGFRLSPLRTKRGSVVR